MDIPYENLTSLREQLDQIKGRETKPTDSRVRHHAEVDPSLEDQGGRVSSFPRPPEATSWTLPIERFSASSFSLLQECPRAWQQRYLLKIEEPVHERQILGSAFHAAMAFNWNCKTFTEKDLPVENVVEFFHDEAWGQAKREHSQIIWDKGEESQKEMGQRLLESYLPKVPHIDPEFIEHTFLLNIDTIPIPIKGIADCVQKGNLPIIDLKTAARAVNTPKSRWKIQGWIYQVALEKNLEWHVVTKNKNPDLIILKDRPPTDYASKHLTFLAWFAQRLYNEYGLEESWPATGIGHDWVCKSCSYRSDCPAWK